MNPYEFTLTVQGYSEGLDDQERFLDFADRVYQAFDGCVEVQMSRGAMFFVVTVDAETMADALRDAVKRVEALGLRVARFGPEPLVSAAQIASRLHLSRERIGQLRKSGTLPAPIAGLEERSPMYRWADVVERLLGRERVERRDLEIARSLERANAALTIADADTAKMLAMLTAAKHAGA